MPLPFDAQWVLVACGLIAHADGVLEAAECDRLLMMLDDQPSADDYAEWMALIGDAERLRARFLELPIPDPSSHRALLEHAWQMALVDGDRCEAEVETLREIARHIGVEDVQLEYWREAWTMNDQAFSERTLRSCVSILGGGGPVPVPDRGLIDALLEVLPTSREQRLLLEKRVDGGDDPTSLGRELSTLTRKDRARLMGLIAPIVFEAADLDRSEANFLALGRSAGIDDGELEHALARARG